MLARRDQRDLPRFEDRGHPHRDRLARHILLAEKIRRGVFARERVERDEARARRGGGTRLVESDVPGLPDAEDLKIDAAGVGDCLLVRRTGLGQPIPHGRPVRDVHVLAFDVHVLEEVLPHVAVVAVGVVERDRVVLVEIERDNAREIDVAGLMTADELPINAERGAPGGETKYRLASGASRAADDFDDAVGDQ